MCLELSVGHLYFKKCMKELLINEKRRTFAVET